MSLLSWLRKMFRDDTVPTRDQLCTALRNLGVDAQTAARGRVEEKIYFDPGWSYGVIDIAEGPIRWVNVTEETLVWGPGDFVDFMVYGVPDPRVGPGFPEVRVKAVWAKTSRGPITGVRWEGEDFGLGIVDRLSQDVLVASVTDAKFGKNVFPERSSTEGISWWVRRVFRVEIRASPDHSCWMLQTPTLAPTQQEWDWYQAIVRHLLATPIPTGE